MKAKLIVDGHEFDIEIQDPKLQALITPPKKTGYERVGGGKFYYCENDSNIKMDADYGIESTYANINYIAANYYSDKTVAENNARADKLMRQLRRFAAEHKKNTIDWKNNLSARKWFICYGYDNGRLSCGFDQWIRTYSSIYFDSEEAARLAIETFHDELMWYFTEYKDSL